MARFGHGIGGRAILLILHVPLTTFTVDIATTVSHTLRAIIGRAILPQHYHYGQRL